jgi:hypothetical protein
MGRIELPTTIGSLVKYLPAPIGQVLVLARAGWDPRAQSFARPRWCGVSHDIERGVPRLEVFGDARVSREGACVVWVAPPPAPGRSRRALRRPGAVALLDGAVYAYCPNRLNGKDGGGCWLNPVLGIGPRAIEHHGVELVPGQP